MVTTQFAQISMVGKIWMPNATGATTYSPRVVPFGGDCFGDDLEAPERGLPEDWREAIDQWLAMHAGDFQSVIDFAARLPDLSWLPWATEEGEADYMDCMYPSDDDSGD